MIKRVAILTSGGDAPGMNAAVRAAIRAGLYNGIEMFVVYEGFKGLHDGDIRQVNKDFTQDIINRGGTVIKSSRYPEFKDPKIVAEAVQRLKDYDIDALIGIGGDGTFQGLLAIARSGFPVVGVPGSIDNDVACTDYTIGFMTALNTICDCVDKIKDTSSSHQKCSIIEVMGRHCGDLALYSSVAEAAELTITSNNPYNEEKVVKKLRKMKAQKKSHAIVIVSENLLDCKALANTIEEKTGFDTNVEILGHLQRGGAPSAFDRILASKLGSEAILALIRGEQNFIVAIKDEQVVTVEIEKGLTQERKNQNKMYNLINMLQ